jgi:elongation factor Ts
MEVSLEAIKELRSITSASIADCKNVLKETGGDIPKAVELLRKKGLEIAAQKQGRQVREGRIESYVHIGNKIGVLVEINCETDFVARNSDFCQFAKDVALQIVGCNPLYIKREDVPPEIIEKQKDKELFLEENCLLEQAFFKDPGITIKDYLGSLIAKIGENVVIRRFVRYKVGE